MNNKNDNKKSIVFFIASVLILILCMILSLVLGSKSLTISETLDAIVNSDNITTNALIIRERIPRTLFSVIAGSSLAVSGALMQSITRNPIADPSILGVNMGASLFVVTGIAFVGISTYSQYILFAQVGGIITFIVVYYIASIGGTTPIKLALAGAAVSSILSSLVSAIILPRDDVMNTFRFWQVGSVGGATFDAIFAILPFILIGMVIAIISIPYLDALALGDEVATGLGVNVGLTRVIVAFAGVLLCSSVTAIAGPIGFVGLMVPHTVRLLFGTSLKTVIPMSMIGGSILLVLSDVIGRVLGAPNEIEVGIITAIIGAPILIVIARKAKVKEL